MKDRNDYYKSDEFLAILHEYEDCEKRGIPCVISTEDYADIAEYYDITGHTDKARSAIDAALSIYPGEIYPLALRARLALVHSHDTEEARYYANQIEDKSDLEYHYLIAEITICENQPGKADSYLEKICKDLDDDEFEDSVIDVASIFADYDEFETAWKWLRKINDCDDEDYLSLLGRTLEGMEKHEENQEILNKLIDRNPFSTEYWNRLAASQYNQRKYNDSISSSEYAIALDPDNEEAVLNIANGLYNLGNFSEALTFYERFCTLKPGDEYGELFRGICLTNLERNEEALKHLELAEQNALPDSANLADIYQEIAYTKNKLGDLDGALQSLDKAIMMKDNQADLLVLKGQFYLDNNQILSAQDCFNQAIRESNSAPEVFYRIAIAAYEAGYINMTMEMLNILYKSSCLDKGHAYMAVCQYINGDTAQFIEHLQKAVEENPQEAKFVMGYLFPENMDPSEYYQFAISNYKEP